MRAEPGLALSDRNPFLPNELQTPQQGGFRRLWTASGPEGGKVGLEGAAAAAQEAGEEELARALVHLSNLLAIGWQGRAVVALAELIEEARAALRRTERGGEVQDA